MPFICVHQGDERLGTIKLTDDRSLIGRDPSKARIHLASAQVSKQHARIDRSDGRFTIIDLNSRNNTHLNNLRVPSDTPQPLRHGDEIEICNYRLVFDDAVSAAAGVGFSSQAEIDVESSIQARIGLSSSDLRDRTGSNLQVKLKATIDYARVLHGLVEEDAVFEAGVEKLLDVFPSADRALAVLVDAESGELSIRHVTCRRSTDSQVTISQTLIRHVVASNEAVLSRDLTQETGLIGDSVQNSNFPAVMCAPLHDTEEQPIGVLQIDSLSPGAFFTDLDLELLGGIAMQLAMAIDNALLTARELERTSFERDLEMARSVQLSLMPPGPADFPGFEFYDFYAPARTVGGDLYDYVPLPGGDLAVVLADVSGKGFPAALVSAKLNSEVRALLRRGTPPSEVMAQAGEGLLSTEHFATLALIRLAHDSRRIEIFNAGHWPPLLRDSTGMVVRLGEQIGEVPLGTVEGVEYGSATQTLQPGDVVILFSDGIIDASKPGEPVYGERRLRDRIAAAPSGAANVGRWVMDDVMAHSDPANPADDITIVCVGSVADD